MGDPDATWGGLDTWYSLQQTPGLRKKEHDLNSSPGPTLSTHFRLVVHEHPLLLLWGFKGKQLHLNNLLSPAQRKAPAPRVRPTNAGWPAWAVGSREAHSTLSPLSHSGGESLPRSESRLRPRCKFPAQCLGSRKPSKHPVSLPHASKQSLLILSPKQRKKPFILEDVLKPGSGRPLHQEPRGAVVPPLLGRNVNARILNDTLSAQTTPWVPPGFLCQGWPCAVAAQPLPMTKVSRSSSWPVGAPRWSCRCPVPPWPGRGVLAAASPPPPSPGRKMLLSVSFHPPGSGEAGPSTPHGGRRLPFTPGALPSHKAPGESGVLNCRASPTWGLAHKQSGDTSSP